MGCGCKGDKINNLESPNKIEKNNYSLKGFLKGLFIMLIVILISPFILIAIWGYTFKAINDDGSFISGKIMDLINMSKKDKYHEEMTEEIAEDNQLLDVETLN